MKMTKQMTYNILNIDGETLAAVLFACERAFDFENSLYDELIGFVEEGNKILYGKGEENEEDRSEEEMRIEGLLQKANEGVLTQQEKDELKGLIAAPGGIIELKKNED